MAEEDAFEHEFADELDALLDMEDEIGEEFSPFPTKSKKSLDFSTPSTQRSIPKKVLDKKFSTEDPLNDSFPTPLADTSPQIRSQDGRSSQCKRNQAEMFGDLSDSDTGEVDLPDITHKKKKARIHSGTTKKDESATAAPTSPVRGFGIHLRKKPVRQPESFTEYQDRLVEGYDLERPRVLRKMPLDRDFIKVTDYEGRRVFMTVKSEKKQERELSDLNTKRGHVQLLNVSIAEMRLQIDAKNEINERLIEESSRIAGANNRANERADDIDRQADEDTGPTKPALWVEQYAPKRYTDLLSDESTNRLLLRWLKQWDFVVFGKTAKTSTLKDKKANDFKAKKGFDAKGKPFFKKNVPEVTDELDQYKRPMHKVVLICGPPGLGKTTLAHVIAAHTGYNVVEMNASDDRSSEIFKTKIEAATQMKAVIGQDPRPNCLIIDEIDGAPQPAINMLLSLIKDPEISGTKKKKKGNLLLRPIICICNDVYTPALRNLRSIALTITIPPVIPASLASRLQQIAGNERLKTDLTTLLALCEKTDNDIRSCLNTLQFVRSKCKELTLAAVNSASVGQKDVQHTLFTVWQGIFNMPKAKRKRYINPHDRENMPIEEMEKITAVNQSNLTLEARFQTVLHLAQSAGESDKVLQGLYENYLSSKVKDPRMDMVQIANDWMCFVDLVNKEVLTNQSYILWRYPPFLPVVFHLIFASNHHPRIQYPHSQYENFVKLNKATALIESLMNDMAPSVRKNMNLPIAVMDTLPPLLEIIQPNIRPVNTQLYSQREKEELRRLIRIMLAYNMTYNQQRNADGQFNYILDPGVDEVVRIAGVKQQRQLTYAAKQLIAREIDMEKMRSKESAAAPAREEKPRPQKASDKKDQQVPNHMQTLQPLALKSSELEYDVDFFGRKIKKTATNSTTAVRKSETTREVIGGDVWFRFKEGFTNAVRRTVRIGDLL